MKEMMRVFEATYYDNFVTCDHGGFRTEIFATKESAKRFLLEQGARDSKICENICYVDEDNRVIIREGEKERVYTKGDYEFNINFIERLNNEIKACKEEIEKIKVRKYKKEETRQAKINELDDEITRCHEAIKNAIKEIAKMGVDKIVNP